jgi:hypothetical protein
MTETHWCDIFAVKGIDTTCFSEITMSERLLDIHLEVVKLKGNTNRIEVTRINGNIIAENAELFCDIDQVGILNTTWHLALCVEDGPSTQAGTNIR